MMDTPTPRDVPVIAAEAAPEYTYCESQITQMRSTGCRSCSQMIEESGITRCQSLSLDINLIISANEIVCPEGVW